MKQEKDQGQPPPHSRIIRKILILFSLLILTIIGNAIFSALLEYRKAYQQTINELENKQVMLDTLLDNELEKLRITTSIVREQNQKFVEFLDYDKLNSISVMMRTIGIRHGVDILLLFNEYGELLTCNDPSNNGRAFKPYAKELLGQAVERVSIEFLPLPGCAMGGAMQKSLGGDGLALCFKAVVALVHDSGDIYGHVVMLTLLNSHETLVRHLAKTTAAEVVIYDRDQRVILTNFMGAAPTFPQEGRLQHGTDSYLARVAEVRNFQGQLVGYGVVATNEAPFRAHQRSLIIMALLPFVVTVAAAILFMLLLKLRVIDRIYELITTLRQVTAGVLTARLGDPSRRDTTKPVDEMDNMAIDFNLMMEKLEETYDQLRQARLEAESANVAKSEFLANMSHELRTPLNAIIGFTEVVLDKHFGPLNAEQEEYLTDVLRSSRHLLNIINDILDLSKVEAGKLELNIWEINIRELLAGSLIMVKEKCLKHGIELGLDLDENLPPVIQADERKIKQVVYNLLANAVKFTPDGGRISVSARQLYGQHLADLCQPACEDYQGDFVQVAISDTGIGLAPSDLERIFKPFEQADSSYGRKFQGTGLGLSLCKKFVEMQFGCIWAASGGRDQGSTFTFVIPVDVSAHLSAGEAGDGAA